MSAELRRRFSSLLCFAIVGMQWATPVLAQQHPESYWQTQMQPAINADLKHDTRNAEALYKALLKQPMPVDDLLEVQCRLAILLFYLNRVDDAIKETDALLRLLPKLSNRTNPADGKLAVCFADLAENLMLASGHIKQPALYQLRALKLQRAFCTSSEAIIEILFKLAHGQCREHDYLGADRTLNQISVAYKQLKQKPRDLEEQLEADLMRALLQKKISKNKNSGEKVAAMTSQMSHSMGRGGVDLELAMANFYICDYAESSRLFQQAHKSIDPHSPDAKKQEAEILGREAAVPIDTRDWKKAEQLLRKRISILKEIHARPIDIVRANGVLALCLREQQRIAEADAVDRESEKLKKNDKPDLDWMVEDERNAQMEENKRQLRH